MSIWKSYVYCFEFGVQKYPASTFKELYFCLLSRVKKLTAPEDLMQ